MNNDELKRDIFCMSRNEKVHKTIEHVIEGFYLNSYRIIPSMNLHKDFGYIINILMKEFFQSVQ